MQKKAKSEELDLFYLKDSKSKNKKKNQVKKVTKNKHTKSNKKNIETPSKNRFDFNDEIVIGVTKIPKEETKKKKTKKIVRKSKLNKKDEKKIDKKIDKKVKTNQKVNTTNATDIRRTRNIKDELNSGNNKIDQNRKSKKKVQKKIKVTIPKTQEQIEKEIRIVKILKVVIIIIILVTTIILTMLSPLFNIKEIKIVGNNKISAEQIISLSNILIGENTYRINKISVKNKIKENAYIESVEIKRNLPSQLEIKVEERVATFMIEYINSYVYINNQGYMLEISNEKLSIPILKGIKTSQNDIAEGKRLCNEDLEKLSMVLKIMEISNVNGIDNLISQINISDENNYTLTMEEGQKIVYLGDCSNLSTRILTLKAILEKNQGIEGEIFINKDLNTNYPVFRQKV